MITSACRRVLQNAHQQQRSLGRFSGVLSKFSKKQEEPVVSEEVHPEDAGFATERTNPWFDYTPPENLEDFLKEEAILKLPSCYSEETWRDATFDSLEAKFSFLTNCINEFERDIPSSRLARLKSVGDVLDYYQEIPARPKYVELRPDTLPLNMKVVMESVSKPLKDS